MKNTTYRYCYNTYVLPKGKTLRELKKGMKRLLSTLKPLPLAQEAQALNILYDSDVEIHVEVHLKVKERGKK